jgi:hypothetical protein
MTPSQGITELISPRSFSGNKLHNSMLWRIGKIPGEIRASLGKSSGGMQYPKAGSSNRINNNICLGTVICVKPSARLS